MKKFKHYSKFLSLALCLSLLCACGKSDKSTQTTSTETTSESTASTQATQAPTTQPPTTTTAPQPTTPDPSLRRSPITGMWVTEELANRTPIAVMISNIDEAMPQHGTSYADVILEAYAEGGITRFCAVFDKYEDIPSLGSLRSCRDYFLYFAKEFEATYFHFGQASHAIDDLNRADMKTINFMTRPSYYIRTKDRVSPHNAFTTGETIVTALSTEKVTTTYPENYVSPFKFTTDDNNQVILTAGTDCKYLAPGFTHNQPYFVYDEASGTYLRYQFGEAHIDATNNQQLSFKNIIVKYVTGSKLNDGYLDYDIVGSGTGLYITNGKAIDIQWTKENDTIATKYTYADSSSQILMNQGKTMILYVETKNKDDVVISANTTP